MQITMQISTADCITVSCQNVDAKLLFTINAHSKKDFNKCLRKPLFSWGSTGPMALLCRGRRVKTVILRSVSELSLTLYNTTFRRRGM